MSVRLPARIPDCRAASGAQGAPPTFISSSRHIRSRLRGVDGRAGYRKRQPSGLPGGTRSDGGAVASCPAKRHRDCRGAGQARGWGLATVGTLLAAGCQGGAGDRGRANTIARWSRAMAMSTIAESRRLDRPVVRRARRAACLPIWPGRSPERAGSGRSIRLLKGCGHELAGRHHGLTGALIAVVLVLRRPVARAFGPAWPMLWALPRCGLGCCRRLCCPCRRPLMAWPPRPGSGGDKPAACRSCRRAR